MMTGEIKHRFLLTTGFATALLLSVNTAPAASGTWNGTQNSRWANDANWSASPFAGSALGETATFDNAGNGNTTIEFIGGYSLYNILFTGASVAPYTIGTGAANSQIIVMGTGGEYGLSSTAANNQRFNCAIQLGGDSDVYGTYRFRNDNPLQTLTLNQIITYNIGSGSQKTLEINGSGPIAINGDIRPLPSPLIVNHNSTSTLTLAGSNSLHQLVLNGTNGVVNLSAGSSMTFHNGGVGNLIASQDTTINGPGKIFLSADGNNYADNAAATGKTLTINAQLTGTAGFEYWHGSYYGTIALNSPNDYTGDTLLSAPGTLQCATIGNRGVASNLGAGTNITLNAVGCRLLYTGTGETTDRIINVGRGGIIEQAGTGNLNFSAPTAATPGAKILTLQGATAGTGEFSGVIRDDLGKVGVAKAGTGTWSLTSTNSYSGMTAVNEGTLVLTGARGAALLSSEYSISNGATLLLDNTTAVNNTNRLNNAGGVTLLGGTLRLANDGGAADFSETAGVLAAGSGASTIIVDPAAVGHTATLQFASIVRAGAGATLNFSGTGLGESDRCRVLISGQGEGLLGNWITVNNSPAYYDALLGVCTTPTTWATANIAARGPTSVIPDDATTDVQITTPGTSGSVTLAGDPINSVARLTQNTTTNSVINTADKTLRAYRIGIADGGAALTLGENSGDGALTPLAAGGTLDLNNESTSTLTVNAAIENNGSTSSISKNGDGNVIIAGPTLYSGPTAINGGSLTLHSHEFPQQLTGAVSGYGAIVKTGTNILNLATANTYTGATYINAGTLRVALSGALGTADAGTVIAAGATLDLGGASVVDQEPFLQSEMITVSGAGADGQGAIVNNSNKSQWYATGNVALDGDTTFGTQARWDIRDGTFTMNNHVLTKKGSDVLSLSQTAVMPGGDDAAIDVQAGTLRLQRTTKLGGSSSNTVHLRSGTGLSFFAVAENPAWSLICADNTSYFIDNGGWVQNHWAGPVTLNGTLSLTGNDSHHGGFSGAISGSGSLLKRDDHSFHITGTNNTYTGQTRAIGGYLYVANLRNVGEACSLGQPTTVEAGTIKLGSGGLPGRLVYTGTGDTTDRVIDMSGSTGWATLQNAGTGHLKINNLTVSTPGAKVLFLNGGSTGTAEIAAPIVDSSAGAVAIGKQNSGTWMLSGNNTYSGNTDVSDGTLVFSGTSTLSGTTAIYQGTLLVTGNLNQQNANCYVTGNTAENKNAVLRVTTPATMTGTGDFVVRYNGAFYLDGGTFSRLSPDSDGERFNIGGAYGNGGYAYFKMSGGTVTANRLYVGSTGIGITRFSGGTSTFGGNIHLGRKPGATAVLTVDGSALLNQAATKELWFGFEGGSGEVNILGGTLAKPGGQFTLGSGTASATSIINICAGVLQTLQFGHRAGKSWLNFCGGTLQAGTAGTTVFIPDTVSLAATTYAPFGSFAGGAVIDSNGQNITIPAAIRAPTGQGIYGIAVAAQGSGYIGEPYVSINGGNGSGATAVANMADDGKGKGTYKVASITLTCPGINYDAAPTVTLRDGGANRVTATIGAVTLAANVSGGLTKIGAGTLTLSGTNTYTGTTTLSGGTLKLGRANALQPNTQITLAGGTLDLGGYTITNALNGTGLLVNGTVETVLSPAGAGTLGTNTLTLTGTSLKGSYVADVTSAGECDRVIIGGNIDLSQFALNIVDTDALDSQQIYTILTCTGTLTGIFNSTNLPDSGWKVVYHPAGTVRLLCSRGTVIVIR